ncbi:MAG TPA: hypothetical protein GX510_06265 [Firmicutes bacterium]|nr:hypothetical protein [Candidatus Fermentithermobacillaceae bacterium]
MSGIRVGRLGSTGIYLHPTLIAMAGISIVSGYGLEFLIFMSGLLFHEGGHLLKASFEGAMVKSVHLWPFGAVARLERAWQLEPRAEVLIAAAGPAHNILMATASWMIQRTVLSKLYPGASFPWLDLLIRSNLAMAALNLLPCLPLDGGRILRAWLSLQTGYLQASRIASSLGVVTGLGMIIYGLTRFFTGNPYDPVGILGGIITWGALAERDNSSFHSVVKLLTRQEELGRRGILPVEQLVCRADLRVRDVVLRFRPARYHIVTVVNGKFRELGRLTEGDILKAYYKGEILRRLDSLLQESV